MLEIADLTNACKNGCANECAVRSQRHRRSQVLPLSRDLHSAPGRKVSLSYWADGSGYNDSLSSSHAHGEIVIADRVEQG